MCYRCEQLTAELAAIEVDLLELQGDIAAGLVPPWARRGLLPHERAAGVNFARIDAATTARAERVARLLTEHRDLLAGHALEQMRAATTPAELAQVVARLTDPNRPLGIDLPGYVDATERLEAAVLDEFRGAYADGLASLAAELEAQGRPAAVLDALELSADTAEQLAGTATTTAQAPGRTIVQQLAAEAARSQVYDLALEQALDVLAGAATTAGAKGLDTDAARVPVQQATARGRIDGLAASPQAAYYYASELLDANTCGPCSLVDGVRYATIDEARSDYPGGTYIGCQGGARCRGTLVAVWDTEAPATVQDVAPVDRPEPPAPPPGPEPDPDPDFGPDAGPPDPLPTAAPLEVEPDVLDVVAAELGVPRADVARAREQLADLRATLRAEAADTQLTARDWFTGGPSPFDGRPGPQAGYALRTPPRRRSVADPVTGRRRWQRVNRDGTRTASYDWIDDLDADELRRLQRRGWFDPDGTDPDELAQLLGATYGDLDISDAAEYWRRHASLTDAAGAVARGKMPTAGHLVDLDDIAPQLAGEGWDLGLILGQGSERDALRHVLTKEADEVGREAAAELTRAFRSNTGATAYRAELGPAPWKMSADSYRLELLDVENEIATARALGQPLPRAAVDRWHELVPIDDLDEFGAPLDTATLHSLIGELARLAERGGWLP